MDLDTAKSQTLDFPLYRFEPLRGSQYIRILTLHDTKDRIECSLDQIPVSYGGYQALSYVWGNDKKSQYAAIREKDKIVGYLPLTANLQSALCDLRDTQQLVSKVFWIDQICIDQTGNEKNDQVALMGQVYQKAIRVITYLGPRAIDETEEEERAGLELIRRLNWHFSDNYDVMYDIADLPKVWDGRFNLPVRSMPEDLEDMGDLDYVRHGWRWLCRLSLGPWTQRLWMVQEQVLNADIILLRGNILLAWETVAIMSTLLAMYPVSRHLCERYWTEEVEHVSYDKIGQISESTFSLWIRRRKIQRDGASSIQFATLLTNLALYESVDCRDPRDRIFSLLAISCDANQLDIQPNYATPAPDVFLAASIRMLKTGSNLRVIDQAVRWANSLHLGLPSWALSPRHFQAQTPDCLSFTLFSAHPRMELASPPILRPNSTTLVVTGCVLQRVVISATPIFPAWSFFHDVPDSGHLKTLLLYLSNWSKVLRHSSGSKPSLRLVESLCRARLAQTTTWQPFPHPERGPVEQTVFHFWCYYRQLVLHAEEMAADLGSNIQTELLSYNGTIQDIAELLTSSVDTTIATKTLSSEEERASYEIKRYAPWRGRSFTLTDQDLACNAMHEVLEGDVVAVLQGSDRLYILRPVGNQYKVIGDAFVYGLMHGEAYEGCDIDEKDGDIELI